jgi:ketosteroid isomerase-like protein
VLQPPYRAEGTHTLRTYLTNHGKPLVPVDNAIKATIQDGDKKTEVLMKAEGDHAVAALAAPVNKGAVIVIAGKISGGHAMTARFVAK